MTKVYIEKQGAPELPLSLVFWPNYRFAISPKRLFLDEIMSQYKEPFFEIVSHPEEADFFAVPFEYFFVLDQARKYLDSVYEKARVIGKKVLLFDSTDYVDRRVLIPPHAALFRVSMYRHHRARNEIAMPYFIEDFGKRITLHTKRPERPIVGFCGLSRYGSLRKAIKAWVKRQSFFLCLLLSRDTNPNVHGNGIFWRRRAISSLRSCSAVKVSFIERSAYSLHRYSASGEPERIRDDYIKNLAESHLALCVRGDANASQRFYEALSAGRIPLFLDTDCVLPFEEIIDYDRFILRIPHCESSTLGNRVAAWYAALSAKGFLETEQRALEAFQQYLRPDKFFMAVFDRKLSPYKDILYAV